MKIFRKEKNAETIGTVTHTHTHTHTHRYNLNDTNIDYERNNKIKRTYIIIPLIFILIEIIVIMCVLLANIARPYNEFKLSQIPIITSNSKKILASETTAQHICSNYYVSKYDKTNHWNECSICGQKYNVVTHTYTETWTMGESCSVLNKCNHICSCGYSYQTSNNREHNYNSLRSEASSYMHLQTCSVCLAQKNASNCTKEDGSRITCSNLGTCAICEYTYSKIYHFASTDKNGDLICKFCNKYIGTISNLVTNYTSSNIFEFSYDVSVANTGNFNSSYLTVSNQDVNSNGAKSLLHKKTQKNPTTVNITGKVEIGDKEIQYYFNSYIHGYYVSSGEFVNSIRVSFNDLSSD